MRMQLGLLFFYLVAAFCSLEAAIPQQQPMGQDEVRDLIKKNKNNPEVILKTLDDRNVDFDLNRDIEKKMRKAGATDDILQAIWRVGPTGRNAKTASLTSATGTQLQATYEEAMGYRTIESETDPEKKLRMVEEFEKRFPNSPLLSYVYTQAAKAAQQRGDLEGTVAYGEKSLKLDPDNVFSLTLVALSLPQPRMQRGSPAEAATRLSESEGDARRVLSLMEKFPKQANETDEQFQKRKSALLSEAHTALGMVHLQRDESDKAIEEFKTAISLLVSPNPQLFYRLGEVYANDGRKNESLEAFTKASERGQGTVMKELADLEIEKLKKH